MKSFAEYWHERREVGQRQVDYAERQETLCIASGLLIRGFEQLALPIEAALAEQALEEGEL